MASFDRLAVPAALFSFLVPAAWAQDAPPAEAAAWEPTEPVEFVVHSGPGAGNDVLARTLISVIEQNELAPVRFQIANKPGGGSTTAINYMVEKTGDAHTIGLYVNAWITDSLTQQEAETSLLDLSQIALLIEDPAIIVVRADSEYQTLEDFVAAAKAAPGTLNQSGGSMMGRDSVVRHVLMTATEAEWNFVSFPSGGERMAALLGGHAELYLPEPAEAGEQVRSGNLRAVAQIASERLPGFPDVPTLQEIYDVPHVALVRGIVGTPDMPPEAVAYYENLFEQVVATEEWQAIATESQYIDRFLGAEESVAFLEGLRTDIREIVSGAGIEVVR